jgi:hypothetical protein
MQAFRGRLEIGWGAILFAGGALMPMSWQVALLIAAMGVFFLVWSFAPRQVDRAARLIAPDWKLNEKLDRLARAVDGPPPVPREKVDRIEERMDAGTEILEREVDVPDIYPKWKRDLDAWVTDTAAFLEREFGNAEREMFVTLAPAPEGMMPGALDPDHSRERRQLMNRLRRLKLISRRYGG